MTDREVMQQALEALENSSPDQYPEDAGVFYDAITALRTALEQPEQEPVAKVVSTAPDRIWLDLGFDPQDEYEVVFHELHDVTWSQDNASGNGIEYVRADTVPPAAQPTCPECKAAVLYECVACSSNNYPSKPEQGPVAWAVQGCSKMWRDEFAEIDAKAEAKRIGGTCVAYPLYTTPPQRQWVGLTDEDLEFWTEELGQGELGKGVIRAVADHLKERNT